MPDVVVPVLPEDIEKKRDAVLERSKEIIGKLQKTPDIRELRPKIQTKPIDGVLSNTGSIEVNK
jgi:hypothetical protein